jgi:hypothetical protein
MVRQEVTATGASHWREREEGEEREEGAEIQILWTRVKWIITFGGGGCRPFKVRSFVAMMMMWFAGRQTMQYL